MATMTAARLHKVADLMSLDKLPIPAPGDNDVLVRVRACGVVPNLANVLANWTTWFPALPLPPLPAVFGLDPAGDVVSAGTHVHEWHPGDRVYVNPARVCGGCRACRSNDSNHCDSFALGGYIGSSSKSVKLFENYPYGGLSEYMIAPQYSLVKLPDTVTFNEAARFGYLGTMYSALLKSEVGPRRSVLINGISGTLGLGGALLALALGAPKIYGTGRDIDLLKRVEALAPERIETLSTTASPGTGIDEWIRARTAGRGIDVYIDALGPGSSPEVMQQGMRALARGGRAYNIGAVAGSVGLDVHSMMDNGQRLEGSTWFSTGEAQDMADLVGIGALDLSVLEHVCHPLSEVNDVICGLAHRNGGFTNFVITP